MNRIGPILAVAVVVAVLAFLGWRAWSPKPEDADVLSGYLEGEALYLASPVPGTVTSLSVTRGQRVAAGAPLFTVDAKSQQAQRAAAVAQVDQARAQAAAAGAGADQQAANVRSAEAQAVNARRDAERYGRLAGSGAVSAQEVDRARTALANAEAALKAAREAERNARDQAQAARSAVDHASASVADADARLGQLSARAPAAGRIEETFFQTGEWAGANQPIVSLIPDGKVKLRFYVPERDLALYQIGRTVRFTCDGCGGPREAGISYVSPRPEFTPPVIYSRKARDRMVFLIEAALKAGDLAPGQPVDVTPLKAAR